MSPEPPLLPSPEPIQARPFRRLGIGTALTLLLAGICILTAALVHESWQRTSDRNANDLVKEINTRIADTVAGNLQAALTNASASEAALQTIFLNQVIKVDDEAKREFVFLSLLQSQPTLSWVSFGWPDGHFFGARKDADDSIRMVEVRHGPADGDQLRIDSYRAVAGDIQFLNRELSTSRFRANEQPWYKAADTAQHPIWSETTATPLGPQPAISISGKLVYYGHYLGVINVAIDIDRLSRLLTALKVTRHGRAFILAPGNRILSAAAMDGSMGGWHDLMITQDPLASAIARAIHQGKMSLVNMPAARNVTVMDSMTTVGHYVTFTPLPFQNWVVATAIPAEDILGDIPAATRRLYMLVVALVVLVSILGAILTHRLIARPIAGIAGDMRRIEQFHLDHLAYRPSRLRELDDLSRALRLMGSGLSAFRKYLPADLVESLIRQGIEARPGGRTQALTVMFTDLTGFTGLTEAEPDRIVEILGDHLDTMSRVVHKYGGTVDKFIGDSVMAFWNAPSANPDHAAMACKAALACRAAFLDSAQKANFHAAGLRIGLNTGAALVGNIGSHDRLNYTAIGDPVNVASRLESLNKRYGTDILIGAATREAAGGEIIARRVDQVAVYGRRGSQVVYELIGCKEDRPRLGDLAWVESYEAAFDKYLSRDWSGAMALFELADRQRGEDAASRKMILRCRNFAEQPPPADWDGIDMAESK